MASAPSADPVGADWKWQLRHAICSVDELAAALELTDEELAGARRAERVGLPLRITRYYLGLCDRHDPTCPVRRQVVPHADEAQVAAGELIDPLGEQAHEVAPLLVRRYPDRVLLVASDQCAVHCRFCTRSRVVGAGAGPAPWTDLEPAFAYIQAHEELSEVIISGGDPLTMSDERIVRLVGRLRQIPHIGVIRLATRVPVSLPQRITDELLEALRPLQPLWLMTHFNHPKELTREAAQACTKLVDAGFPVLNQTVLLAGVNDTAEVLAELFRALVRLRIKPYYLHQMDPVVGASHLRTPLQTGIDIMERLQGRLSGIALPKLIVDTPGGMGKVPIGPDYVVARAAGRTRLRTHRGVEVDYLDP